jgi:2-oxoglutarate ferredoxin oxidoreductase subunit beta
LKKTLFDTHGDTAWCPGCGNFGILSAVKEALDELGKDPHKVVMVSGIGQAAKAVQYMRTNYFNGLHGRALPAAVAIKAVNPALTVICESGDGDIYGEGGNHFIHNIRRNSDVTVIVHNNMVYGLTKGQASPTSLRGFKTPVQISGVEAEPFNPLAVAISLNASFVARAFTGDRVETTEILKAAITHRGFSIVDIFQPCVTFNKVNTYKWFRDNTYYLEGSYDKENRVEAFERSVEAEPYPLGIFYVNEKPTFEDNLGLSGAAHEKKLDLKKLSSLMEDF